MAARRPDPVRVAGAVREQAEAIADWLGILDEADWSRPSPLPEWTVTHLVLHLAQALRTIAEARPTTASPLTAETYLATLPPAAAEIRDRERASEASDPVRSYATQLERANSVLEKLPGDVVQAPRGPLRTADFLATRALELVVHADDLGRTLPDSPPPLRRSATAVTVRMLADVLATRAPGRSVEVRIPPHAAVQCIPGPRHTRGTPPTVIETDPVTWLRLATGRVTWAEALEVGRVSASGERSDLSVYLPLVS